MVVMVRDLVPSNQLRANGNDWFVFYQKVKDIVDKVPPEEEVLLDFDGVTIAYNSGTLYATNIITIPNVSMKLYNSADVCDTFKTVALMAGKPEDTVVNTIKESGRTTVVPLTEKEKLRRSEKDIIYKFVDGIFAMGGIFRLDLTNWRDKTITSICSRTRADDLAEALYECVKMRVDRGEQISKIIIHTEGFNIASFALDKIADDALKYRELGCNLIIKVESAKESDRLKLKTEIGAISMTDEQKIEVIRRLGKGRVGMLTRFKHRRELKERHTDETKLRMENVVVNQYIAVIRGLSKNAVVFEAYLTSDIKNRWDEFMSCGDDICTSIPSTIKTVKLHELGLEHLCLGKEWHFNRFDGAATGIKEKQTYCTPNGECSNRLENVSYAEWIRRCLLAYGIEFNNAALASDARQFEMDMAMCENRRN